MPPTGTTFVFVATVLKGNSSVIVLIPGGILVTGSLKMFFLSSQLCNNKVNVVRKNFF